MEFIKVLFLAPLLFTIYVNDILHLTQGKTAMHSDVTLILNVGQDIKELQKTTSENTGLVEQYFQKILFLNLTKTHYILFQMKQCRQESKLKNSNNK
jgi:hypothetical protein